MRVTVAVLALAALLALPSVASAGSVGRGPNVLMFNADLGETNRVSVEGPSPNVLVITDAGAPIRIGEGSGCAELDPQQPGAGAQCFVDDATVLAVGLADGSDRYVAEDGVRLPDVIDAAAGDDNVLSGAGPSALAGGSGDDRLEGGDGQDALNGGDGVDLLIGGPGGDDLIGGPADDRIDARSGGGIDTVTCEGDDAIIRGPTDRLEGCGAIPSASLRVPRQRIRAFFDDDGFDFRVRCAEPCAIEWEIVARDRSTRRRIHQRDRRLDKDRPDRDADGFPEYLDAGTNVLHARPIGRTTRRDIRSARRLRLRLVVKVIGRNSLERTLTRDFTLRR